MHPSIMRRRLRSGEPVRLAFLYYPNDMFARHAAAAGFDAVCVDAEHNEWAPREIKRLGALHRLAGIDCLVRTGARNPTDLARLLEDGAAGIIAPLIGSAAEAAALGQAVKFPPLGRRGMDGAGLDNDFAVGGARGYAAAANAETLLVVQIETPEAVEEVEAIAAAPGVDGLFFGLGDLSLRLGCEPDWREPRLAQARTRAAAAAQRRGIAWGGVVGSAADTATFLRLGARLLAHGSDFGAVRTMLPVFSRVLADGIVQAGAMNPEDGQA
ncbi:MAG: hypothetical protein JNG83_11370 [Opitutaceae bacterium]|nr:hypothetical protein [Opitutaceae bacterium]